MARTTTKSPRRHRSRAPENPVEPIVAERLRAALRAAGLTQSEAARRAGVPQPTLNAYVTGTRGRCHRSVRVKLEDLLDVPPGWLAGGSLNQLPPQAVRALDRAIFDRVAADEPVPDSTSWAASLENDPPGVVLTLVRFRRLVLGRLHRDLVTPNPDHVQTIQERDAVAHQLLDLVDARHWRARLLPQHPAGGALGDADVEAATQALAKAFELVLGPWLDGSSSAGQLDRSALAALATWAHTQETP